MTAHATAYDGDRDDRDGPPFVELCGDGYARPEAQAQVAGYLNLCFVHSVLDEGLDRKLRAASGITVAQHEVLYRLSLAAGGRLQMTALADALLASRSGASRLVARMEQAGLVARQPSTTDRRQVFAALTPRGRSALAASTPVFVEAVTSDFGLPLDAEDHDALRRILRKLLAAHGAWDERRCEPPSMPARRDTDPEGATR